MRRAALFALGFLLAAGAGAAEEWHEAYRDGVQALAHGDQKRAVLSLRRAIALRPEPGRNVVTYGTNIESRYFPYLRLAEACIGLGQLDDARGALETSAAKDREPADERRQLQARLDAALEARRPAPPAAAPPQTPAAPPSTLAVAPSPEPTPVAPPLGAAPLVAHPTTIEAAPSEQPRPAATPSRRAAEGPSPQPAEPPAAKPEAPAAPSAIEIVSQPGGAQAYLDDEPLGTTDPETGRLVKTGLRPGRHRVRVTLAGHDETVREVEVPAVGTVALYATLTPRAPVASGPGAAWMAFGAVAVALVAVMAWMALRRPEGPGAPWAPTPSSSATPRGGATPAGHVSPGARRDEQGQEWFGEFRLLELLGRGGMASVYKAERRGELSALKRPYASFLEDADFLERFLREAEIGRALNHPNIVRILGRGNVDAAPYFTMELLAGQTLDAFVAKSGAAPPRAATSIVAQVAEALDFAHSKGVVHRDLKPSNIMLLPDGTAKVMDFGIARARRFEGLTATGAFLGTPDYVAPEIIEGLGAEPRSDLYSLGAVYYELLTGQRPFTGETAFAVLKKHCAEEAVPPSKIRAGIPAELDALVGRLLAKAPEGRPASAEDLVVELRDWLNRAA